MNKRNGGVLVKTLISLQNNSPTKKTKQTSHHKVKLELILWMNGSYRNTAESTNICLI